MRKALATGVAAAIAALLLAAGSHGQTRSGTIFRGPDIPDCGPGEMKAPVCRVGAGLSEADARARLAGKPYAYWAAGDEFFVVVESKLTDVSLCCSIQAPMRRIDGTNLWVMRARVARLGEAMIDVSFGGRTGAGDLARSDVDVGWPTPEWRGANAPPPAPKVEKIAGRIVEETIESRHMGDRRKLSIYLPPGHDPARRYPVIYFADGASGYGDILEALVAQGKVRPAIIVGVPNSTNRPFEYILMHPEGRGMFAKHEAYFLEEVMPLAEARYGASKDPNERMLAGYSKGADWALETGLRHPDLFRHVAGLSPMMCCAGALDAPKRPSLYIGSGLMESSSGASVSKLAKSGPADLDTNGAVTGHTQHLWRRIFAQAAPRAFPPR
jgi:hypothetical protein